MSCWWQPSLDNGHLRPSSENFAFPCFSSFKVKAGLCREAACVHVRDEVIRCCPRQKRQRWLPLAFFSRAVTCEALLEALPLFFGRGFIFQTQAGGHTGVCPNPADSSHNYWYTDIMTETVCASKPFIFRPGGRTRTYTRTPWGTWSKYPLRSRDWYSREEASLPQTPRSGNKRRSD